MARIKNMGTATMKFGEGIIVTGSAGEDSPALVISGTSVIKSNVSGDYSLLVDNDQSNQGHGLKVTSDGSGTGTNVFDVESGTTNLFRVRADGRVGIGKENPGAKLDVSGNAIVSGSLYVNLEGDGESLKIVGTLDHENFIVFEQPAGSNRAYFGLDAGDNLDVVNMSNNDDINFFTTHGDTKATMVLTANNRVGVGKFGWAGKNEYGMNEAFPRDELDVSGSMRVSENVELMGSELVVSGTITGRYDSAIPGNALMFKNTEVYFVTTDDDVNNKTMAPDENIFFSGSIGSRGTSTKGTGVFGGDLVVSGNMRLAEVVNLGLSGSNIFGVDADNEMHVTAGGVLSYKVKNDGNVEFQTAVTSSHFKVEGSGGQFVAFNEDTVKLKHVNWYSSNDRQYGQGQLWYQQWFGAIEPSDSGAQGGRRIGFFFYEPNKGASDAAGGSGAHPTNTHMYLDLNGMYLQTGSFVVNQGDVVISGSLKSTDLGPENEIVIVGSDNALSSSNLLTIDPATERIGIGTTSPSVKLDMVGEASGETQIRMAQHHNGSDGPDIRFFTSRGTAATPTAVANDDNIGRINSFAYNGTSYVQAGTFGWDADGTDGDSTFNIRTRVGGTTADRLEIDASGNVSIPGDLYFEDYIMAELSIAGLDIQADTNAYTFNCPYNMTFERMDAFLDTVGGGDLDVEMRNVTDNTQIFQIQNMNATSASDTSASNANADAGDRIRFEISNVTGSPQGLRVNVRFRRRA